MKRTSNSNQDDRYASLSRGEAGLCRSALPVRLQLSHLGKAMLLFYFIGIVEGNEVNSIDELTAMLKAKNAGRPCARCGNTGFEVVGEQIIEVSRPGTGLLGSFINQPQMVQAVLVACSHCGNISTHSIGILSKPSTVNWL